MNPVKRTVGALMVMTGTLLAIASAGPLSWGLGAVVACGLIVAGVTITVPNRPPEDWI